MPQSKHLEQFECEFCNKVYKTFDEAAGCEKMHDIIYVPFRREDIKRLWSFIVTGNPAFLNDTIEKTLRKYNKVRGHI